MKMDKKLSASRGLRPLTPTGADPGFARRRTTAKARNASLNGGSGVQGQSRWWEAGPLKAFFVNFHTKTWPKVKDLNEKLSRV